MPTTVDSADTQQLLAAPTVATEVRIVSDHDLTQERQNERYEDLLRRAQHEDLSEISGIGCIYRSGSDRLGRPVVCVIGKWFNFGHINLDKALLYIIRVLHPLAAQGYTVVYFHTCTTSQNHPSLAWLREVHQVLDYRLRKNLAALYIVHPGWWTRLMTWCFTSLLAPAIRHKIHHVVGVEFLYSAIEARQLEFPAFITEHDMTVNGFRYFVPESD